MVELTRSGGRAGKSGTRIRPAYSPALAWPGLTAPPAPAHPVGRSVEHPGSGIVRSPGGTGGTTGRHDLPPVHPAEEPDRLRSPERRHFAIVRVQQHQPGHALGVGQRPVDGRWARGVVRDEDGLPEPELGDDSVEVTDLIVGGVRVAGRLIRTAPPEKIKSRRGRER